MQGLKTQVLIISRLFVRIRILWRKTLSGPIRKNLSQGSELARLEIGKMRLRKGKATDLKNISG